MTRLSFMSDGDGHWYLIPIDRVDKFNKMLEEGEDDSYCEFNNEFYDRMCNHPSSYSFVNPEEL